MASATAFRFSRSWQRRISGAVSAVLCLWLLAFATHFHTPDQDYQDTRSAAHLCGYCTSLSSAGATPHVGSIAIAVIPDEAPLIPADTQPPSSPLIVSHRSRAPPVA